jgi:pyruvate dehydrogenase E2 component (dihydrolipoamide acetyltransferase)
LNIDLTKMEGSGKTGRIREQDIRVSAAAGQNATNQPIGRTLTTSARHTIAGRMLASVRSTAPVTLTTTADATNLVNMRRQFQVVEAAVVPTYTDFFVKLVTSALGKHRTLNASWDGDQIVQSARIDVCIAVDTEAGLLAPVVRDVGSLTLRQVAERSRDLVERARQRTLKAEELQGGTFTVSNLGAYGIDAFTPIINYPQCAILGIGRVQRRPVVVQDQFIARDQVTLSLTFDHRIVDGAPAARFLQALVGLVENPGPALVT